MVVIETCQCEGRPPHLHRPERYRVRLDTDAVVTIDRSTYDNNRDRIVALVETLPPTIEWCD